MLLATALYQYAKEAQQIQQIVDFAILLSAFLRLRVLLSTEAGLGSRARMISLQLRGLQLSAPCLAACKQGCLQSSLLMSVRSEIGVHAALSQCEAVTGPVGLSRLTLH